MSVCRYIPVSAGVCEGQSWMELDPPGVGIKRFMVCLKQALGIKHSFSGRTGFDLRTACSTSNVSVSPTSLQINETQTMLILFGFDNYWLPPN